MIMIHKEYKEQIKIKCPHAWEHAHLSYISVAVNITVGNVTENDWGKHC